MEADHLVRAREVKESLDHLLELEIPDAMAYLKLRKNHIDARRLRALPSHGRASKIVFAERFCGTAHGACWLRQNDWGTVKGHIAVRLRKPVLRDELQAVYLFNLAKFARDVKAGGHSKDCSGFCVSPCPHHTQLLLNGSKIWWIATKFKKRHRTESEGTLFVGWHSQSLILVPLEETRRLHVAAPPSWKDNKPCRVLAVPSNPVFA